MTSLDYFHVKLEKRTAALAAAFERLAANRSQLQRVDRFALQEGLVSHLWQAWSGFSRSVVLGSLKGAFTKSGLAVSSAYSMNSIEEIRYAAKIAAENGPPIRLKALSAYHLEPTWGDLAKLNNMVSVLAPSNSKQLLSAFGSAILIGDLQIIRNACAHINQDRITSVRALQVRYGRSSFIHPSDAIFWIDPITNEFAWQSWIDEMLSVSTNAVF